MKYPEMKPLFLSALVVCMPAQAATTLFDDFSTGVSSDKYRAMQEKVELNTLTENLDFSAECRVIRKIRERTTSASGNDSSSGSGAIHPFVLIFAGFLLPAIAGFRRS